MSETTHPRYPNPTIIEAVCEIHFRLPAWKHWRASLPGELFKRIQEDYPEMEPIQEVGLTFEFGPLGLSQKVLPARPRMRFKHTSGRLLLQFAENVFTVNVLAPYPGWESMRSTVLDAWQEAMHVLRPATLTRVALRYINRIERTSPEDQLGDWLRASDYIAPGVLLSEHGFLSRIESQLDAQNRIIVTLGDELPEPADDYGAIIFDIDRIAERELLEREALKQEMTRLHEHVWQVFRAAETEKLDQLLERGNHE